MAHIAENIAQIRDRLTWLEANQHHEKHAIYREVGGLALQVQTLRQEMSKSVISPMNALAWIKLILAFLLPVAALLATGSVESAVRAARLLAGH